MRAAVCESLVARSTTTRTLSDGSKPPTLPRWLVQCLVLACAVVVTFEVHVVGYVVGFFVSLMRH
jgi:hypothetical protein